MIICPAINDNSLGMVMVLRQRVVGHILGVEPVAHQPSAGFQCRVYCPRSPWHSCRCRNHYIFDFDIPFEGLAIKVAHKIRGIGASHLCMGFGCW